MTMKKPDDSSLDLADLSKVEAQARQSLDKAAAWGRFPTPVDDILAAAKLRVAPKSAFDPASLLAYAKQKAGVAMFALKAALSKVLGLYDANEQIIHIDEDVVESKQKFLMLHETGHHEMPTHRKIFTFFQDCEKSLSPDIADQFEREANNFARFALFQGSAFQEQAADMPMGIKTPMTLGKKFGASNYASAREFARTHHRACVVFVLEPIQQLPGGGFRAPVRRIECSAKFRNEFGFPPDLYVDSNHPLADLIPLWGKRMTRPTTLHYQDKNGDVHECLGEGFDTKHNILLLVYPVKALSGTSILMPGDSLL